MGRGPVHALIGLLGVAMSTHAADEAGGASAGKVPGAEAPPARLVLEGVPRVGYDVHLCPFPGSLYACLEYLHDPVEYDVLMGVTGAAFRRLWNRDDGGNIDLMYLAPEPARRAFEAIGRNYRTVPFDRDAMLEAIRESLGKRVPVIAFGIIGPPEAGIVTGYGDAGGTLFGWSYFQDGSKPGYYEQPDWFEKLSRGSSVGLVVVGEPVGQTPSRRETLVASLEWAVDLALRPTRPGVPDHVSGLAAYDAWAKALEVDADYPRNEPKVMETRAMVHCDQVVMLHERGMAAAYLRRMADVEPAVTAQLQAAATLYEEVGAHASLVWRWGNWMEPEAMQGLADGGTRREFAQRIRAARAKEAQAVELLRAALATLREPAGAMAAVSHLELQPSKLVCYPRNARPQIEGMPVPSALRATMEFVGQDFGYSLSEGDGGVWRTNEAFPFFMGVWGDAFEFVWLRQDGKPYTPDAPPDRGDLRPRYGATLHAAGFDSEVHSRSADVFPSQDDLRRQVVDAIAERGLPALLVGVPGPEHAFVATGYARGGNALVGWSVQGGDDTGIQFAPDKRLVTPDWYSSATDVVLLTERHERPPETTVYRDALQQGLRLLRQRQAGQFHAGPATFDAWAALLADPALSKTDPDTVSRRQGILDPMIWDLATRRHYGRLFLHHAARLLPAATTELNAAAECFAAEHDLMWEVNRVAGGDAPGSDLPKLVDPPVREQVAALLLQSRDKDIEAAALIEKGLAVLAAAVPANAR